MKKKVVFICSSCGYNSLKWLGKCPNCGAFNSFLEEEQIINKKKDITYRDFNNTKISSLKEIDVLEEERIKTKIEEVDRVFGGGIVKGSITLIGGEPGVGKSTLALEIGDKVATEKRKTFYFSGEESDIQIKMRAERLNINNENLYLIIETKIEKIVKIIEENKPDLVIIDSIQTVYKEEIDATPGTITQIRESCAHILYTAKKNKIPVIIIGHVTKEGALAGPKILEHMVDTVMYFESEKYYLFKILRTIKNRFGSTNEIGIFEMSEDGLKEVKTPSKILLDNIKEKKVGSAIVTVIEGTRPLLLEIQALTSRRNFGMPQRTVTGVDYNRFLLLIAILERSLKFNLYNTDIFLNITGGIKIFDTSADLGIVASIYSAYKNIPNSTKDIFIGELGLDGEIRSVRFLDIRIKEAQRLGFRRCFVPEKVNIKNKDIEIIKMKTISDIKEIIK